MSNIIPLEYISKEEFKERFCIKELPKYKKEKKRDKNLSDFKRGMIYGYNCAVRGFNQEIHNLFNQLKDKQCKKRR